MCRYLILSSSTVFQRYLGGKKSTFIFLAILRFWLCYLNKSEHNVNYTPTLTLSKLLMFICDVSLASEISEKQIKSSPEEINILFTKEKA